MLLHFYVLFSYTYNVYHVMCLFYAFYVGLYVYLKSEILQLSVCDANTI